MLSEDALRPKASWSDAVPQLSIEKSLALLPRHTNNVSSVKLRGCDPCGVV
jgi:hypothetical protein